MKLDISKINIPASLPKNILFGGITLVLILAIIYAVRFFKQKPDAGIDGAKESIDKSKLTFPLGQYGLFADQIEEATDGFGTDEAAIYDVFESLNNISDVSQLIVSYGKRWYPDKVIPYKITLGNLMAEELDHKELSKVNDLLSNKGINYKF